MKMLRWLGISVLVIITIILVGLAPSPPAHRPAPEVFSLDGQEAVVMRPGRPSHGRLVIYVHGASGSTKSISEEPVASLTRTLLAHGFAVAASNAHGPQNWGNPASVRDYVRLARQLGFPHIVILAQSMGGLDGLQLISKLHPQAWAGIYPVCDANSAYANPELTPFVREGWGGPPPAYVSPVRVKDIPKLRVLIWASPEDKVVSFRQNAVVCAREMRNHGARVNLVKTTGDHGDLSNFRPQWLVRFFEAATASS